jgi:hypothetical protein
MNENGNYALVRTFVNQSRIDHFIKFHSFNEHRKVAEIVQDFADFNFFDADDLTIISQGLMVCCHVKLTKNKRSNNC